MDIIKFFVVLGFLYDICSAAVLLNLDAEESTQPNIKKKPTHEAIRRLEDNENYIGHKEQNKKCCKNGGHCILGSFCKCPKNFYGRYCEHEIFYRSCQHILHNHWIRSDCDFCKCFDGSFYCIPGLFTGCENERTEPLQNLSQIEPLKGTDIEHYGKEITDEDPSYILEDYYYIDDYSHSKTICIRINLLLFIVCLINVFVFPFL